MDTFLIAAVIFVFTYIMISVKNIPWVKIGRGTAAAIGGLLMVVFGVISVTDAFDYINFDVIFLLIGMMMLVAGLEFSGFFQLVSDFLIKRSKTNIRLLAYVMVICGLLSAIALNDAVVLIFTPIVIKCCRQVGANPIPYLIGVMFSANIGSLMTSVGNPQNAYIASEAGISFLQFSLHTVSISLVCLPVAFLVIYALFRKKLDGKIDIETGNERAPVDRLCLGSMLILTVCTFIGFVLSGSIGIPIYAIAMISGMLALVILMTRSVKNVEWVARRIDWSVIIFFIGLFVLMGGVVESGLLDDIASLFPGFGPGESPSVIGVTAFSAVLSNLVSNVPAVVLIGNMLPVGDTGLWIALASSATLAGNTTLIGSAANMIVAERSERLGVTVDFWKFAAIGIPVTVLTLLISVGLVSIIF